MSGKPLIFVKLLSTLTAICQRMTWHILAYVAVRKEQIS